ncbi:MAG: LysM peptidoglycan-binding domain-containing protein [Saprospiraceae bacterium]
MRWILPMLLLAQWSWATGNHNNYLTQKDTIIVRVTADEHKVFNHVVEAKQTLYSMARFYGLDVYQIYDYNPWLRTRVLAIHDTVIVPLDERLLVASPEVNPQEYVPVYYAVRSSDNLFRISKIYFNLDVDHIKGLNHLNSNVLSIGQLLLVGYISIQGAASVHPVNKPILVNQSIENQETAPTIASSQPLTIDESSGMPVIKPSIKEEVNELKESFTEPQISYVHDEQRGIALWNKDIRQKTDLYAMHRNAPIGSTVEISNPMINKTVYAKIIANMPEEVYPDNVCIIVSPAVANLLGAVDTKFFVKVKYLAPQIKK